MLIGIDANEANLTTNRVGVNQYAFNLIHALRGLDSSHHFLIYLKNPPLNDLPEEKSNWHYRVIPFPKLWTQTRLPLDLFFHKPRPNVFFSATHYGPRFSPVPTVVSIMDLGFLQDPDQFTVKDYTQLKSWTEYSVKKATKIISISEFTKNDIIKYYKVDPKDIVVTTLGYDKSAFGPKYPVEKSAQTIGKYSIKTPFLFYLGSLKPSKNIPGLIKAFAKLMEDKDYANLSLVVSGKKAWNWDSIFWTIRELGLEEKVIFTDFLPQEDAPILMSNASAFVMPSFYEGFGIPILEAMASRVPVVTSSAASLPEVGGNAVVYVDPYSIESIANGIKEALSKNKQLTKLGMERVKLFSWEKTARETLTVLESAEQNK